MVKWHPLGTIWHPFEGAGMQTLRQRWLICVSVFVSEIARRWVSNLLTICVSLVPERSSSGSLQWRFLFVEIGEQKLPKKNIAFQVLVNGVSWWKDFKSQAPLFPLHALPKHPVCRWYLHCETAKRVLINVKKSIIYLSRIMCRFTVP